MEKLKAASIHITGTSRAVWPQRNYQDEAIDVSELRSKFNGAYCMNNSTICFVHDGEIFVTPCTREAMATLSKAGMVYDYFYVPFSNGDYPKGHEVEWENLRAKALETDYSDFERDCAKWCDQHDIGELSSEVLARCFKMPRGGVAVKHHHYETTLHPACGEYCMDCTVVDKLGKYCTNNGRVVFIYRDGHTYVAGGYWIVDHLIHANFRSAGLFVPFSNGEQILDPVLAAQWQATCRKK